MKTKVYLILYYLCFILSGGQLLFVLKYIKLDDLFMSHIRYLLFETIPSLSVINLILVIVFTILLIMRKKLKKVSLVFPISYLTFLCWMFVITLAYNRLVILPYMQFFYFFNFVLVDYLLLNIYSLLSLKKAKAPKNDKKE